MNLLIFWIVPFHRSRSCLYDDVFDSLGDVRKLAVESMKKLRERSGQNDSKIKQMLIDSEVQKSELFAFIDLHKPTRDFF